MIGMKDFCGAEALPRAPQAPEDDDGGVEGGDGVLVAWFSKGRALRPLASGPELTAGRGLCSQLGLRMKQLSLRGLTGVHQAADEKGLL